MISIHIVSYNKSKYLISAVQSILNQKIGFGKYEVLILEGGSDEENILEFLKYRDTLLDNQASVICYDANTNGNLGLAAGLNYLHSLQHKETQYIVEMNEDMFFAPNAIQNMVGALANNPDIGLACANLVNGNIYTRSEPEISHVDDFARRYTDNEPLKINRGDSNLPYAITEEFYSGLSKFDVWKEYPLQFNKFIGIWDESIDPYGVGWHADWDIYQRVRALGKETAIIENAHAYHYDHCSGGELDKSSPNWTAASKNNYLLKYGTMQKDFCFIKRDLPPEYPVQYQV